MQSKKEFAFLVSWMVYTVSTVFLLSMLVSNYSGVILEWELDWTEICGVSMVFLLDKLGITMIMIVSIVSASVLLYSNFYMSEYTTFNKFIMVLVWFVTSMWVLCASSNLFMVMLGWDMLGLSSFCLIMFYQNWGSYSSSMITFLSNRLGDLFLIFSIVQLWSVSTLFSESMIQPDWKMISFIFILGAISKSAQIPFSAWLPEAMAAPTPVSSLVHSSTLVTAGIYLLMRFQWVYLGAEEILSMIALTTIVLAGGKAMLELDLKKLIAYSTLSHISIMVLFVSLGSTELALFHLFVHAVFKSMLFMLSGVVIHNSVDTQDFRYIFIPIKQWGLLWVMILVSTMSMVGAPFLSGFYSKELMVMLMTSMKTTSLLKLFGMMSAIMFTAGYSFRLLLQVNSIVKPRKLSLSQSSEDLSILNSLLISLFLSICLGSALLWLSIPFSIWESETFCSLEAKLFIQLSLLFGIILGSISSFLQSKFVLTQTLNTTWMLPNLMKSISLYMVSKVFMLSSEC
nr:NADH dehydrogenase subunit 5 [Lepidophthirus macrorhini]